MKTGESPKLKELEREVGRFCFDVWSSPGNGRLLVLAGSNGAAKTLCAEAVRNWVRKVGASKKYVSRTNHIKMIDCLFWRWGRLLDHFKNGGWDVIEDMFEATVLIIDDLGAAHDPSGVGTDKLCQILSQRERKWTLVTTNFGPDEWEDKFDRRVASRLFRNNSRLVDLAGVPDYCV